MKWQSQDLDPVNLEAVHLTMTHINKIWPEQKALKSCSGISQILFLFLCSEVPLSWPSDSNNLDANNLYEEQIRKGGLS